MSISKRVQINTKHFITKSYFLSFANYDFKVQRHIFFFLEGFVFPVVPLLILFLSDNLKLSVCLSECLLRLEIM